MKEELIKMIEEHSAKWSSKSELTIKDVVEMHGEKCASCQKQWNDLQITFRIQILFHRQFSFFRANSERMIPAINQPKTMPHSTLLSELGPNGR